MPLESKVRRTTPERDPTVRGQELGDELRILREATGFTIAAAAHRIDASVSKLSRIETGRRGVAVEDVAALLAVYDVQGARRRELLTLAREAQRRGWWQRDRPGFAERQRTLISLEAKADHIVNFEGMVIPGLLQTGEYTRAVMVESKMVPEDEIENRMVTRLRRHAVLLRQRPPSLTAIIDELALRRVVGGEDVLRRQMPHLVEVASRPDISLRIVPNNQAHAGSAGAFEVLHRDSRPSVVFVENLASSLFLEEKHEILSYQQATRRLLDGALDEEESVRMAASLAEDPDPEARTSCRVISGN